MLPPLPGTKQKKRHEEQECVVQQKRAKVAAAQAIEGVERAKGFSTVRLLVLMVKWDERLILRSILTQFLVV